MITFTVIINSINSYMRQITTFTKAFLPDLCPNTDLCNISLHMLKQMAETNFHLVVLVMIVPPSGPDVSSF